MSNNLGIKTDSPKFDENKKVLGFSVSTTKRYTNNEKMESKYDWVTVKKTPPRHSVTSARVKWKNWEMMILWI